MAAPMVFDAPGRLSTITGLPSESESFSPSKRATMSLGPPVVTGTTKRMLLVGYADWPCAASGATAIANDAAAKAEKCLRVVNRPSPADEDRGAGTQSGNAGQRLRQDEEHGPESTDVPAGAAHQQQARANQQQPERNEQGPRVREEGIELRLPHVGRESMSRRDGETTHDHLHHARDERRRSGIACTRAGVKAKTHAFRDDRRQSREQKRDADEKHPQRNVLFGGGPSALRDRKNAGDEHTVFD